MPGASEAEVDRFLIDDDEGASYAKRAARSFKGASFKRRRNSTFQKLGNLLTGAGADNDSTYKKQNAPPVRRKSVIERVEEENEMRVVDWDFNSPYAIALEYIESNQGRVSAV